MKKNLYSSFWNWLSFATISFVATCSPSCINRISPTLIKWKATYFIELNILFTACRSLSRLESISSLLTFQHMACRKRRTLYMWWKSLITSSILTRGGNSLWSIRCVTVDEKESSSFFCHFSAPASHKAGCDDEGISIGVMATARWACEQPLDWVHMALGSVGDGSVEMVAESGLESMSCTHPYTLCLVQGCELR